MQRAALAIVPNKIFIGVFRIFEFELKTVGLAYLTIFMTSAEEAEADRFEVEEAIRKLSLRHLFQVFEAARDEHLVASESDEFPFVRRFDGRAVGIKEGFLGQEVIHLCLSHSTGGNFSFKALFVWIRHLYSSFL